MACAPPDRHDGDALGVEIPAAALGQRFERALVADPSTSTTAVNEVKECIVSLTQYYTATALDGFIADPDNSLDWLFTREQDTTGR